MHFRFRIRHTWIHQYLHELASSVQLSLLSCVGSLLFIALDEKRATSTTRYGFFNNFFLILLRNKCAFLFIFRTFFDVVIVVFHFSWCDIVLRESALHFVRDGVSLHPLYVFLHSCWHFFLLPFSFFFFNLFRIGIIFPLHNSLPSKVKLRRTLHSRFRLNNILVHLRSFSRWLRWLLLLFLLV